MISFKSSTGLLITYLLSWPINASPPNQDCIDWFNNAKIVVGAKDCELKCVTLSTDMNTFMCSDQCNILCKPKEKESLPAKLVFYPGLTQVEKELVVKNPKQALLVFNQKGLAEDSVVRNFPEQNLNDESDAFRHFVWAGLLTKELGREKAEEYLNAHETDPDQPEIEKQMDIFNNDKGQTASESLIRNKKWSLRNLESQGLKSLHANELKVISPGLSIPKEPK